MKNDSSDFIKRLESTCDFGVVSRKVIQASHLVSESWASSFKKEKQATRFIYVYKVGEETSQRYIRNILAFTDTHNIFFFHVFSKHGLPIDENVYLRSHQKSIPPDRWASYKKGEDLSLFTIRKAVMSDGDYLSKENLMSKIPASFMTSIIDNCDPVENNPYKPLNVADIDMRTLRVFISIQELFPTGVSKDFPGGITISQSHPYHDVNTGKLIDCHKDFYITSGYWYLKPDVEVEIGLYGISQMDHYELGGKIRSYDDLGNGIHDLAKKYEECECDSVDYGQ